MKCECLSDGMKSLFLETETLGQCLKLNLPAGAAAAALQLGLFDAAVVRVASDAARDGGPCGTTARVGVATAQHAGLSLVGARPRRVGAGERVAAVGAEIEQLRHAVDRRAVVLAHRERAARGPAGRLGRIGGVRRRSVRRAVRRGAVGGCTVRRGAIAARPVIDDRAVATASGAVVGGLVVGGDEGRGDSEDSEESELHVDHVESVGDELG